MSWQPIGSAPRDGTEMLGYRPDQGVFMFRWAEALEVVPKDRNGDPVEDYDDGFEGWLHDVWGWLEGAEAPTRWQPKPAPPEDSE